MEPKKKDTDFEKAWKDLVMKNIDSYVIKGIISKKEAEKANKMVLNK